MGEGLDVALDVFAVFQRVAHGIEGVCQCVDLAADADIRLGGAFAAFDSARVFGDLADGAEQPEMDLMWASTVRSVTVPGSCQA